MMIEMATKANKVTRNQSLNIKQGTECSRQIISKGCRRFLSLKRDTFSVGDRISYGEDGQQNRKEVVNLSAFLARVEGVLEGDEEIDRVADVKTDGEQLKEHVDIVIGLAERFFIRQNVEVKDECVEDGLDVEEILEAIHVVGHQDNVEVGYRFQY